MSKRIKLWDLPTRLFHWLLVVGVLAAVISGELGGKLIEWHARFGLVIVGLLAFRLVWGIFGSTYARFARFFPTPGAIAGYLKGRWKGQGHNPLGALSVFGLLSLLAGQAATGLFANDDIAFHGPLYNLIDSGMSGRLTGFHGLLANLLLILVAVHVAAIVFYVRVKKEDLIRPMMTGWKDVDEGESAKGGGPLALVLALLIAALAVYGASGTWLPAPVPPAVVETPAW